MSWRSPNKGDYELPPANELKYDGKLESVSNLPSSTAIIYMGLFFSIITVFLVGGLYQYLQSSTESKNSEIYQLKSQIENINSQQKLEKFSDEKLRLDKEISKISGRIKDLVKVKERGVRDISSLSRENKVIKEKLFLLDKQKIDFKKNMALYEKNLNKNSAVRAIRNNIGSGRVWFYGQFTCPNGSLCVKIHDLHNILAKKLALSDAEILNVVI